MPGNATIPTFTFAMFLRLIFFTYFESSSGSLNSTIKVGGLYIKANRETLYAIATFVDTDGAEIAIHVSNSWKRFTYSIFDYPTQTAHRGLLQQRCPT